MSGVDRMKHAKPRDIGDILRDTKQIEKVLGNAVRAALLQHKRAGNPVAEWRDGKVVWVQPKDIPVGKRNSRRKARRAQTR